MIFAAGFLTATLLSLLVIPAINGRAERLSRRRVEALFPLSVSELTAEKDHLRAEFAVTQRRLERRAEEALAAKQADMEELGRRAVRVEALEGELGVRDARIAGLEKDLAETRARLGSVEQTLAETLASLASTREILGALNATHATTLDELATTRAALETATAGLAETRADLASARDSLGRRTAEHADLDGRHSASLSDIDAKRITISDLENRLGTQTARGDEAERALRERRAELSEERRRLADLYKNLNAEQDRGLALEGRVRLLQADRDAKAAEAGTLRTSLEELRGAHEAVLAILDQRTAALGSAEQEAAEVRRRGSEQADAALAGGNPPDANGLADRVEALEAVKASLENALATAHEERARLEGQLRSENADLRWRIDELADEIMRAAEMAAADGASSGKARPPGKTKADGDAKPDSAVESGGAAPSGSRAKSSGGTKPGGTKSGTGAGTRRSGRQADPV